MISPAHTTDRSARMCERTGLRLSPSHGQATYRVARPSYGALNPLPRSADFSGVRGWGRWDTAGGRTIYTAESQVFAYLESLAYLRPSDNLAHLPVGMAFPDSDLPEDLTNTSVLEQIRREWEHKFGGFGPGKNPLRWREARALYQVRMPMDGWFIDIGHADSIAALNRTGEPLNGPFHPTQRVTLANLFGEDRRWTCRVATLLREAVLDDGSLPHGIVFHSKHGDNGTCWAYWLRQVDDGKPQESEPVDVSEPIEIQSTSIDGDLKTAADILGICLY